MRSRIRVPLLPVALAGLASLLLASAALAAPLGFNATLVGGDAEDPPGDPDGTGTAAITIDLETREVCWEIDVQNIADATASHIHVGAAGASGDVVVGLDTDGFSGSSDGCVTADAAADLQAIVDNPAGYYVNIHTADFAPGAIRGQLTAAPPDTAVTPSGTSPVVLIGLLLSLVGLAGLIRAVRRRT